MFSSSVSELPPPPQSGGGSVGTPDPIVVLLLNLFILGGTGYLLISQQNKAIVIIVLWLVVGAPTCFSASLLIAAITAVDGWLQAQQLAGGRRIGEWTFFKNAAE